MSEIDETESMSEGSDLELTAEELEGLRVNKFHH